ncbi:uncharacterized protein PHALS_07610 [Plasmopara halstedii]|uniref:Uncharacterized protein n=1 Tax=Plasmopara halstedii TaxID=4781 RepID=A0A0P1B7Z7_PLAHL|nr:uncharacterized protein PHALS_07610 [Plasmopara halstedii]CEG49871.1 hypothetical protein PHALS_07610 [Plasmopara halstedii]|eukprot:XP_024586240.1 hypothetical protein PHALS_07610 [Plasmopara halstedii]
MMTRQRHNCVYGMTITCPARLTSLGELLQTSGLKLPIVLVVVSCCPEMEKQTSPDPSSQSVFSL